MSIGITFSVRPLRVAAAMLLMASVAAAGAQDKKKAAPAVKAPAAKAPAAAAHPAGGASTAAGAHGATTTTASHGPTTSSPGGTTTSHPTTTTAGGTGRTTTTTAGGAHTAGAAGAAGAGRPGGATAGAAGARGGAPTTARSGFGGGHPTPAGAHETKAANGAMVRTRANGTRSDLHDEKRGMDVHRNLDGNRRINVERADHTRIYAERGGRGFVQHPYRYHDREFGRRTYWEHGHAYDRYYGRYYYGGAYLDVYAPVRFYGAGFYGWAYNPWAAPAYYSWGWGGSPWYGYYGAYFTPYQAYPSAAFWLTDYMVAASLQAAYAAQAEAAAAGPPPPAGPPVMTPEIKAMISAEVGRQVALENAEAQANAAQGDVDPAKGSIAQMLSDNQPHVFVVGTDLDLVAGDGTECPVSQGDVLQVAGAPAPNATSVNAVVLTSKSWKQECHISGPVTVAFADLQDMQNHMRETIDAGMQELQAKAGQGGLPAAPPSAKAAPVAAAFVASAPPPDPNVGQEIQQQSQAADQAEQEVATASPAPGFGGTAAPAAAPAVPTQTATIAIGQSIDEVTASMGAPKRIIDLGAKKIYVYSDMKVTFKGGKVSDVE